MRLTLQVEELFDKSFLPQAKAGFHNGYIAPQIKIKFIGISLSLLVCLRDACDSLKIEYWRHNED